MKSETPRTDVVCEQIEAIGTTANGCAKYTQEQAEARLAEWDATALMLPRPTNGAKEIRNGIRFRAITLTNGQTGSQESHWELMTSNWNEAGIIWPETLWPNDVKWIPPKNGN
jgi:hypothetical protein